ncbi:hypothetical protein [Nevskia sp.]|uniref:hypothetical protein n=1 Tax=Nevskia sp. TaxID=1929292 RepID=UPI0025EEFDE6|nr:hypothetical protein [Nevskia sp.]
MKTSRLIHSVFIALVAIQLVELQLAKAETLEYKSSDNLKANGSCISYGGRKDRSFVGDVIATLTVTLEKCDSSGVRITIEARRGQSLNWTTEASKDMNGSLVVRTDVQIAKSESLEWRWCIKPKDDYSKCNSWTYP